MPLDLPTAQQELDEARALLATLQEQVRAGDEDVTAQSIAAQRELITFAELRVEAAQRTETRFREDERAALGAAARDAALNLIEGDGMTEIGAATKAAVEALAHLAALANARNARIAEIAVTLSRIDEELKAITDGPQVTGPWGSRRYGVWGARDRIAVPDHGVAERINVGRLSAAVVVAGLGSSAEGREAQEKHRTEFHGLRAQVVASLTEAYPVLAEALQEVQS